jgi:hypothetical protein
MQICRPCPVRTTGSDLFVPREEHQPEPCPLVHRQSCCLSSRRQYKNACYLCEANQVLRAKMHQPKPTKIHSGLTITHTELKYQTARGMKNNQSRSNIKTPLHSHIIHFDLYYWVQLKVNPHTILWIQKMYDLTLGHRPK